MSTLLSEWTMMVRVGIHISSFSPYLHLGGMLTLSKFTILCAGRRRFISHTQKNVNQNNPVIYITPAVISIQKVEKTERKKRKLSTPQQYDSENCILLWFNVVMQQTFIHTHPLLLSPTFMCICTLLMSTSYLHLYMYI